MFKLSLLLFILTFAFAIYANNSIDQATGKSTQELRAINS